MNTVDSLPRVTPLGTTALLFEVPGTLEDAKQQRVWALAEQARQWPQVREAIPCLNNLMLVYREPPRQLEPIEQALLELWERCEPLRVDGRLYDIPVRYGGAHGPGLAHVASHTGLTPMDVVRVHSEQTYTVYGLGSHPGHCYLAGLDPRLATPRRQVPLLDNPGGSVSIGGSQTSFSVSNGPTGWWAIGRTGERFFDPSRFPPALMQPGDRVRFHVLEVAE
ncbi:allophanate hydrolase [Bordetella genomosp. 10]|uniref:Allophanate hydrolase n=1 Tax=Bordetella genomosp. 10 TaxID=1416804 RepID=A0A261S459_9BORD|nr:5-oxoprolinase subunit PxpB [Bordetella genomosp. 10]OZI31580.1 allophanate hydrolase [Bordetella genomosp. 10]